MRKTTNCCGPPVSQRITTSLRFRRLCHQVAWLDGEVVNNKPEFEDCKVSTLPCDTLQCDCLLGC